MEIEFIRMYQDQYLFDDVVRELSKIGFRFVDFTDGKSLSGDDRENSPRKRIWNDTLFLRDKAGAMQHEEILKAAIILCELGYDDEAIWFMQDHGIAEETIASIANLFRTIAVSNEGFIRQRILYPIMVIMKKHKFPGRSRAFQILSSKFAFIRSLMRKQPI